MSALRPHNRGIWRGVYSSIVDHPDWQGLTPNARLALLVCRVGSLNTPASIFRYYPQVLEAQTGLSTEELEAALAELEKRPSPSAPWIVRDASVLWIRNGLRYDPGLTLEHAGHRVAIERAIAALPSTPVVRKFKRYYKLARGRGVPATQPPPSLAHSQGGSGKERTPKGKEEERKEDSGPSSFLSLKSEDGNGLEAFDPHHPPTAVFNDCGEGRQRRCVKSEYLALVANSTQCYLHDRVRKQLAEGQK